MPKFWTIVLVPIFVYVLFFWACIAVLLLLVIEERAQNFLLAAAITATGTFVGGALLAWRLWKFSRDTKIERIKRVIYAEVLEIGFRLSFDFENPIMNIFSHRSASISERVDKLKEMTPQFSKSRIQKFRPNRPRFFDAIGNDFELFDTKLSSLIMRFYFSVDDVIRDIEHCGTLEGELYNHPEAVNNVAIRFANAVQRANALVTEFQIQIEDVDEINDAFGRSISPKALRPYEGIVNHMSRTAKTAETLSGELLY